MSAAQRFSPTILPLIALVAVLLLVQRKLGKKQTILVDTLSAANWTEIESVSVPLRQVHSTGQLHHKVWILPFDDFWRLLQAPKPGKCKSARAFETHVHAGAGVASAASEIAERIRRTRRVMPLIPLGRPFLYEQNNDREVVHAFAMIVQGTFNGWGKVTSLNDIIKGKGCARAVWMKRLVSYAYRRFKVKGITPKGNPLSGVDTSAEICCDGEVDISENLEKCAVTCGEDGVYDVVSMFPRER